jgi:hypothetical protein
LFGYDKINLVSELNIFSLELRQVSFSIQKILMGWESGRKEKKLGKNGLKCVGLLKKINSDPILGCGTESWSIDMGWVV